VVLLSLDLDSVDFDSDFDSDFASDFASDLESDFESLADDDDEDELPASPLDFEAPASGEDFFA
jgi:hypothetical protein